MYLPAPTIDLTVRLLPSSHAAMNAALHDDGRDLESLSHNRLLYDLKSQALETEEC